MCASARKGHVNFGSEDCTPKDNSITINECSPGHVQVNLGFLRYHHLYNVTVEFPKDTFMGHTFKSVLTAAEKSQPNVNCKVISMKETEKSYEFVIEFHANRERLLTEELILEMDKDEKLKIEFKARVLGIGKGTPLLKNGVKCIGVNAEELSDVSDWQAE